MKPNLEKFKLHNNDVMFDMDHNKILNSNYERIGHAVSDTTLLTDLAHEYLCEDFPDRSLFNYYIDDKHQFPCKRMNMTWDENSPDKMIGKSPDLNEPQITFDITELPLIWQEFFKEINSVQYKDFLYRMTGSDEELKMYGNFWLTFSEKIEESLDNYQYLGKSVIASTGNYGSNFDEIPRDKLLETGIYSVQSGKYIKDGFIAPAMKPHVGSGNKKISLIYYLNTEQEWKTEYGGRTTFFDLSYVNQGIRYDTPLVMAPKNYGNRSTFFRNTEQCWHGIEDIKVPTKSLVRKNFIVVTYV